MTWLSEHGVEGFLCGTRVRMIFFPADDRVISQLLPPPRARTITAPPPPPECIAPCPGICPDAQSKRIHPTPPPWSVSQSVGQFTTYPTTEASCTSFLHLSRKTVPNATSTQTSFPFAPFPIDHKLTRHLRQPHTFDAFYN